MFIACRDEYQIQVYDIIKCQMSSHTIDCYKMLKAGNLNAEPRDCRPISMTVVDRATLWIGCENGQIIIVDVAKFPKVKNLDIIWRNNAAVRSISVTPRLNCGSASVVTSGKGFKSWLSSGEYGSEEGYEEENDGYVLIWDAELPKQKKHMLMEHQKRNELAAQMAYEE